MAAPDHAKVLVVCPRCGHPQSEPRTAISSVCKKCSEHLRVQEILNPAPRVVETARAQRRISCFECGSELEVPPSAESTMCKRCSRYIDLKDYRITSAVSKNFKTKGSFVVEAKGYVFNTEAIAAHAVIKGRFLGKLTATESLTIYSTADIKGSFTTRQLIVPAANQFRWTDPLRVDSAEIAGELAGTLEAAGTVVLKSSARMFGDVRAAHMIVEEGAVMVGALRIGPG